MHLMCTLHDSTVCLLSLIHTFSFCTRTIHKPNELPVAAMQILLISDRLVFLFPVIMLMYFPNGRLLIDLGVLLEKSKVGTSIKS